MASHGGPPPAFDADEKLREFRALQETLNALRSDLGTLMAQKNENDLVKQVRRRSFLVVVCDHIVSVLSHQMGGIAHPPHAYRRRSDPRSWHRSCLQELDICAQDSSDGGESVIYKQVGPVLIKNQLQEARDTVEKRLEFISGVM